MSDFDPFDGEVVADPVPHYRRLQQADEPAHCPARDLWVLARYEHVRNGARDAQALSSGQGVAYTRLGLPMMISYDPPAHSRLRRLVAKDFTPRAVERWRPAVERLVDECLKPLLPAQQGDWVEAVAGPLPVSVIAEILAVPGKDRPQFKLWSDDLIEAFKVADQPSPDMQELQRSVAAITGITDYFTAMAAERRGKDGNDFFSRLVAHEGEAITKNEIAWMGLLLLVAGHETTTNLLGTLMLALCQHPEQWEALVADRSLVPAAVEEALRYASPVQGFFRTATTDYHVGSTTIPRSSRVLLSFAAANRDPEQFPDPDAFQVGRNPEEHLAFGSGPHHCLGAHLARMETRIVLEALLDAGVRRLRLAGDYEHTHNPTLRGLRRLPIAFDRE